MGDDLPNAAVHPPTTPAPAAAATRYPICISCGYDLSGIPAEGRCPECGVPVVRTLQGARLQFSPPEYLATVRRGAAIVAAGVLAWLIVKAAVFGTAMITGGWLDDPPPEPPAVLAWLTGSALLVALYGWWLVAAPDPLSVQRETMLSGRRALRCSVLCAGAAAIVDRTVAPGAWGIVHLAIPMIWLAQLVAAMLYVQHLAGRIPEPRLQRMAMVTMGVSLLMFIPCLPCMMFTLTFGPWVINSFVLVTVLALRTAVGRVAGLP